MGRLTSLKALLAYPAATALLLLHLSAPGSGLLCERGRQFLDHELQRCVDCTQCDYAANQVVFLPCQVHKDTVCTPLGKLLGLLHSENRHRHQKHRNDKHKNEPVEQVEQVEPVEGVSDVPFSGVEELVWDWQAVALTFAVFACVLFFLAVAGYSLHQARQWRRLKENFDADVEELSARLSLMAAASNEKGDPEVPNMASSIDPAYLNNRCVYLEKLLHGRKENQLGSEGGNVYIEETKAKT